METEAEKQQKRAGVEDEKEKRKGGGGGGVGGKGAGSWREEEVKALLSVWPDRGPAAGSEAEGQRQSQNTSSSTSSSSSRADWERISSRLRELGVQRSWIECQAQCKALGAQARHVQQQTTPAAAVFSSAAAMGEVAIRLTKGPFTNNNMGAETSSANQRGPSTLVSLQEGGLVQASGGGSSGPSFVTYTGSEGGRHWSDDEVRALLSVWADRHVQQQLQHTLRNKAIFQEMARRLHRQYGVVRDWKQCRTKYKNLKYEYKISKSAQAAGLMAAATGGQVRAMKFFSEVETILQGRELESPMSMGDSDQFNVITVHDSGRNWSEEEVDKLITIWSEDGIRRQLENSTRNKNIFVQISRRLLQQGVERDWKQCRTKYKNLKYLYRSLQRGKADIGDPRRIMKYYDQLDTILSRSAGSGGSDMGFMDSFEPNAVLRTARLYPMASFEEQLQVANQDPKSAVRDFGGVGYEPRVMVENILRNSEGISVMRLDNQEENSAIVRQMANDILPKGYLETTANEDSVGLHDVCPTRRTIRREEISEATLTHRDQAHLNRARKRKATDEDNTSLKRLQRDLDDGNGSTDWSSRSVDFECKEEQDQYIPIIEISSVCSMATPSPAQLRGPLSGCNTSEHSTFFSDARLLKFHAQVPADRSREGPFRPRVVPPEIICLQCVVISDTRYSKITLPIPFVSACRVSFSSLQDNSRYAADMASSTADLKLGQKLNEGKTKQIFELPDEPGHVLVQSKDQITAGNAVRKDQMEGKAAIANKTTSCVFKLLQEAGIKTAFVRKHSETAFVATHCEMIPIEWVCRRVATGSFLKRNPGVKEGYRFSPLKMETFFKDDANNDPQWSEEQLLAADFNLAGLAIGRCEVDIMNRSTVAIFEVLEKAWATQNCTLVDMKIEFGVNVTTKEIVLADVIDNDSWRLWPAGDRSQQKDKQVYRDLKEVTPEAMQMVKRNFEWVAERVQLLLEPSASGRVVVLMGSTSDMAHCEKIRKACGSYGIPCLMRVTSAHKGPDETLRIKAEYEGDGVPTVFVAVAGRSNGLGPVMSGNTAYPVINCPPITPDWGAQDVWSSLRMPSGLGCSTVLSPDAAAQFAAQIFGLTNHLVWCKLRASMLNTWISLKQADKKLQACSL
ncbi:multifunctional protein ADE2 [Engraulis encrasicolus]|uniref:multifunctional protein ADE2 n=1 Tax=Engraulis encrasicolus TaxID=184585 RepID=UPI002FD5E2D4